MRTLVNLSDEQIAALHDIGSRAQLSRAELVRRAVAEYLDKHRKPATDAAFGLWQHRQHDALSHEDRLRAEWA